MPNLRANPNTNPVLRNQGLNNPKGLRRESGRIGRVDQRRAEVPSQSSASPKTFGANYRLGPPQPPLIKHDNGFLDKFSRRPAELGDYAQLAIWTAKLEAAEAVRPDLVDGTAAYRHFLQAGGQKREFSYERYVQNDQSGRTTLRNAIIDIQDGAETVFAANPTRTSFNITGGAIGCGSGSLFPYPATENWQKAIGGHTIWLSGVVTVDQTGADVQFEMVMTLHAEDRYNFNPNQADITTGIPDSANGAFELTGLANQYAQKSTLKRHVFWKQGQNATAYVSPSGARRQRMPQQNRRLRNKL